MDDNTFFVGAVSDEVHEGDQFPNEKVGETSAGAGPVEELIPPIILREMKLHPHLSTSVFGYDIKQMSERPWAKPGAVQSDYFNYGFTEKTWRIFCAMQAEGTHSLVAKAEEFYQRIEGVALQHLSTKDREQQQPPLVQMGGGFGGLQPGIGGSASSGGPGGSIPPPPALGPRPQDSFFKTRMCQRFQDGRCTRGANCSYAHGQHELRSSQAPPPASVPRFPYPVPPQAGHMNQHPLGNNGSGSGGYGAEGDAAGASDENAPPIAHLGAGGPAPYGSSNPPPIHISIPFVGESVHQSSFGGGMPFGFHHHHHHHHHHHSFPYFGGGPLLPLPSMPPMPDDSGNRMPPHPTEQHYSMKRERSD